MTDAYIPMPATPQQDARNRATLRAVALHLGLIPECQPIVVSMPTYADRGEPRTEVAGYLLTCQTCGSELTTDRPALLVHLGDEHEVQYPELNE